MAQAANDELDLPGKAVGRETFPGLTQSTLFILQLWCRGNSSSRVRLEVNVFFPYTVGQAPSNNWLMSKIEAEMAIAIFLDDTATFQDSVRRWAPAVESY